MSALGLAAHWAPASALGQQRKIGYCVIGLGRIAGHFLEGAKNSEHSQVTALVSGHREKAEKIAAQYGVPRENIYSYEDFDRIKTNPAIDAVYVALPNSMHAEYTIRAAKAGKHVLCEKPMAINVAECEQMIAACNKAKVKLMIAYRLHFEPTTLKALEIVRSGKLGSLQTMQGANGFNIALGEWRYMKKLAGGGSIFDVGVYCVNAHRMFTGEEPVSVKAEFSTPEKDDVRFKEVEENASWVMRFPSGVIASASSTYGSGMPGYYKLYGTKGWLQMDGYSYAGQHLTARYAAEEKGAPAVSVDILSTEKDPMQFVRQADHFSDCILNDKKPQAPGEEGLADMRVVESIYKAAGAKL
jgi:predicted dehydrogenase